MLECGLRAVVLHNKEVVWNYYAEFTADCRRINTNAKKVNNLTVKNVCYSGGGYGRTLCINGDYYGKAAPTGMDCYYIAIDGSAYKVYIGLQQHGTSVVTWR